MKKSQLAPYSVLFFLLIVLLLFPSQSITAGREGLLLWFNIIIPTLFPFMILSTLILHSPLIELLNKRFTPLLNRFLGVSGAASYALFLGCLSGYPMGAFIVADLFRAKQLSKGEATYLLALCNNASPMFIIGFVATSLLGDSSKGVPLLVAIYIGNIFTAIFYRKLYPFNLVKIISTTKSSSTSLTFSYFDQCIVRTSEILIKVGGYVILFSLPVVFLSSLPIHNIAYHFMISCIDLSNGVKLLANTSCQLVLKCSLLSALCAFGSLSVVGQTASVLKGSGLSIKNYFIAKCINASITFSCSLFLFQFIL